MQISTKQFRRSTMIIIILVLTGLLAVVIPFFLQYTNQGTPLSVTVAPVRTVNKPLHIERAGSVAHATTVPVYSEGAGRVSDVYVTMGQAVKAGQPLIKLEMTGGEAVTASSSGTVEVSSAAKDAYESALKDYNKYQKLYEQGAIARKMLEAAEARLRSAQTGTQSQQGAASSVRTTTSLSGPVTIQASIDGTIIGNVISVGSAIQSGQELMALGSGQDVEIVVSLTESELYFIQPGSQAVIEAAGQQLAGQISEIYPEVKDMKIASFMAHIKLLQMPEKTLIPGMPVAIHIATGQEVGTIAIPPQAVGRDEEGRSFIFLVVEGKAVHQQVTIGETIGALTEIKTSIPQDSLVITSHVDQLKSGDVIAVVE